jgi:protein SCO1
MRIPFFMSGTRWVAAGLALVLATAGAVATVKQPATRGSDLENFHLVGPTGHAYSIDSFPSDTVLIIYFGYTTCLRSCPTALNSIAEAIDRLGTQGASVRPVFIDMDPEPATLASMPLFMQSFGPSFLGLTGSTEQIEQAARAFKVQVERIQFGADPTDYAMKHTSPIFVMRPHDPHPSSLPATSPPAMIEAMLRKAL